MKDKLIRSDRVAIYIRWSTDDQGEGTTLEVQREACTAYIRSQGWTFREELCFVDDGCSGASLDRPALSRLRHLVAAGEVDCVVVYKLDRLSRSVLDMVKLVLDEWEGCCHLKSAREPVDTLTQAGKLFFYQLMSFAEWERSVIRERTFAGKLRRAAEGRNPGITAAYGYRLGPDGVPVVEPAEAAVVERIFRLYLAGLGCVQIARRLDAEGHPSPAGRSWSAGQISRMLSNPIYQGTLVYGKQVTVRGRRVRSDRPHLVREGAVRAVVDPATFAAVQALKARRPGFGQRGRAGGRSAVSRSLLTGLLRCRCGHPYCGSSGGARQRERYRYYCCGGAQARGPEFCRAGRIPQADLDDLVVQTLLEQLRRHPAAAGFPTRVARALDQGERESQAALARLTRELERCAESRARLRRLLSDGRLAPEEYRELQADLAGRQSRLEEQRRMASARTDPSLPEWLGHLDRCFAALADGERKQVLRCFLSGAELYRDPECGELTGTIAWRLPLETKVPGQIISHA